MRWGYQSPPRRLLLLSSKLCDFPTRLGAPESLVTQGPLCRVPASLGDCRCPLPPWAQGGRCSHPPSEISPKVSPPFLPGTLSPIVSHLSPRKSFIKSLRQVARSCLKWRGRGEVKDTGEQTQVNFSINDWAMDVKVCMRDADVLRSSRRWGARQDGSQGHAEGLAGVTRETSSEGTQ